MSIFKKRNQSNPTKGILIRGDEKLPRMPFSYNKDKVHLGFSLDIENKTELKDFRECLVAGIEDVDKYIGKLEIIKKDPYSEHLGCGGGGGGGNKK